MSIHINNHIKQWSKSDNVEEQERKVAFLQKLANDGNFPKNKFEAMELYLAEYGTEEEQKEHQDHYRGGVDIEKLKAQFSSTSEENESPKSSDRQRKQLTGRTVRNVVSDPNQRPPRFSIHINNHIKQWSKSDNEEEQEHKTAFLENLAKEDKFPRNKFEALEQYYAEHGTKEQQEEHANSRKEFVPKEKEAVAKPYIKEEHHTSTVVRRPREERSVDSSQRPPRFSIHTNNHIKQWSKSDNQQEQEQKVAFLERLAQEDKFPRNKFEAMELFYAEHGGAEEQVEYTHKNGSVGVDIEKLKAQFSTTTTPAREIHTKPSSSSSAADRHAATAAASKHLSGQTVRNLLSRNEKFDSNTQQRRKPDSTQHKDHRLPIFCGAGKLCGHHVNYHLPGHFPTFCDNSRMKHDIPAPNKRVNHSINWTTILCVHCRKYIAHDDLPAILTELSCTACHTKLHCGMINQFGVILH